MGSKPSGQTRKTRWNAKCRIVLTFSTRSITSSFFVLPAHLYHQFRKQNRYPYHHEYRHQYQHQYRHEYQYWYQYQYLHRICIVRPAEIFASLLLSHFLRKKKLFCVENVALVLQLQRHRYRSLLFEARNFCAACENFGRLRHPLENMSCKKIYKFKF